MHIDFLNLILYYPFWTASSAGSKFKRLVRQLFALCHEQRQVLLQSFCFRDSRFPCCTLLCSGNRTLWTAQKTFNRAPLSYLLNVIYILYILYIYTYTSGMHFQPKALTFLPLFEWELMFGCTHWGTWHDPVGESHPVGQPFTGHASDHCP